MYRAPGALCRFPSREAAPGCPFAPRPGANVVHPSPSSRSGKVAVRCRGQPARSRSAAELRIRRHAAPSGAEGSRLGEDRPRSRRRRCARETARDGARAAAQAAEGRWRRARFTGGGDRERAWRPDSYLRMKQDRVAARLPSKRIVRLAIAVPGLKVGSRPATTRRSARNRRPLYSTRCPPRPTARSRTGRAPFSRVCFRGVRSQSRLGAGHDTPFGPEPAPSPLDAAPSPPNGSITYRPSPIEQPFPACVH